jgi:aldehyde dehydrogenase (NAD+)
MSTYTAIIGGERVSPDAFDDIDPATGRTFATVARCGPAEVDAAVGAARATFETAWRHTLPAERARLMHALADLLRRDHEALARLESQDTGKPLKQAKADATVAARYFEFYANTVESLFGNTIPALQDGLAYTVREPYGVNGHIVPWNYPLQIGGRTIAPALATGNCCVLKPAEEAPLTAIRLGELALEAGFPPGALNVVPGLGEEAGAALAAHPGIDHLAFTGSPEVGALVTKAAADHCVPVTLELGGKSPNIVFADADLDAATPVIVNSIVQNAGQTCSAGSRLLVDERVREPLVAAVAERMRALTLGPGLEDPDLGPIISAPQRDRVAGLVDGAREDARLVTGGGAPARDGYFFEPTLFDGVAPEAAIFRDEVFGPVIAVTPFAGAEEAAALANATPYGLIAAIWTSDVNTAHWLSRELRVGQVYVNTYGAGGGVELPFGGYKRSGHGREKGYDALLAYTQVKSVALKFTPPGSGAPAA